MLVEPLLGLQMAFNLFTSAKPQEQEIMKSMKSVQVRPGLLSRQVRLLLVLLTIQLQLALVIRMPLTIKPTQRQVLMFRP